MKNNVLKTLQWVGSSKKDLKKFPEEIQGHLGFALYQAQEGLKHRDAKYLKGIGSGVIEIISRYDKNTFRAVYTVKFEKAVYVLHSFQKKSRKGIKTPKQEIKTVERRLIAAQKHYEATYENKI